MNNQEETKKTREIASWYTQIGRLKRAYTSLTNADLNYEESQVTEMVTALEDKLGVSEKDIRDVMAKTGRTHI